MRPEPSSAPPVLEFKGGNFTLPVLRLLRFDLEAIGRQLPSKLKQARAFFRDAPLVIDIEPLEKSAVPIDFTALVTLMRQHHLHPVGVRRGTPQQRQQALMQGLALLPEGTQPREPEPSPPPMAAGKLVTQPVRSGQQIYAQGGDLVILAAVNTGAEVLADGHIHVYAPLRGRALAGVQGDTRARIFCQCLEAELISIAGNYLINEDLDESVRQRAAQVYLKGKRLFIEPL